MSSLASLVGVIVWKDVTLDLRRRVEAVSVLVFAVAAGVLVGYVAGIAGVSPAAASAAELLVLLFLAVFGVLSSFVREADRGTLDGLRSAPVPPEALYLAKMLYTFLLMAVNLLAYSVSVALFGGVWEALSPAVLGAALASALHFSAVSSLASAILVFSEARGVLMPVMVLVLALPFVQLAAPVLAGGYAGAGVGAGALLRLSAAAVAFSAVGAWLSRYVLEVV